MNELIPDYVTVEEIRALSVRSRVWWAATIYEPVLSLLSPYYRETFFQVAALATAQQFVQTGKVELAETRLLIDRIEQSRELANDEGFGIDLPLAGLLVLEEIVECDGSSLSSVDYSSQAFQAYHLFRQGMSPYDPAVPEKYSASLTYPVYRAARVLFDALKSLDADGLLPDATAARNMINGAYIEPLPETLIEVRSLLPPLNEGKRSGRS